MNYARFCRQGYFIGSDIVESARKQIAVFRLKRLTLLSLQRSRGGITLKDTLMLHHTQGHSNNAAR